MLRETEEFNNLLLFDRRKIGQKLLDAVATLEIVEKILYRDARS
jgi:hypothetical protein